MKAYKLSIRLAVNCRTGLLNKIQTKATIECIETFLLICMYPYIERFTKTRKEIK